jgi:hypothetical protein
MGFERRFSRARRGRRCDSLGGRVDSTVSLVGPGSEVAALYGGTHVLAVDYAKAVRTLVVPQTSAPIVTRKTTVERSYAQS